MNDISLRGRLVGEGLDGVWVSIPVLNPSRLGPAAIVDPIVGREEFVLENERRLSRPLVMNRRRISVVVDIRQRFAKNGLEFFLVLGGVPQFLACRFDVNDDLPDRQLVLLLLHLDFGKPSVPQMEQITEPRQQQRRKGHAQKKTSDGILRSTAV